MAMKRFKKARFDSERNCYHCLFFRDIQLAPDGSVISGTCLKDHQTDLIIYHGVGCEDWKEDPKNPLPKRKWTEEELEAQKEIRRRRRERGDKVRTSIKAYREKKHFPKLGIKAPLIKSKKKQELALQIHSENKEAEELLAKLFSLPKRSSSEGRKIRRRLRSIGFYLSRKPEEIKIKRPKLPKVKKIKGKRSEILELAPHRKKEFIRAGIIDIDPILLNQCAYYPRPKGPNKPSICTECSFNLPNPDCKYSHILIDTRIEKRGN